MTEFAEIAAQSEQLAAREKELDQPALDALEKAAVAVERAWSKSNLGYQANVYYEGFKVPPPGAFFSREWGFLGTFSGTTGNWSICSSEEVKDFVRSVAGSPDISESATTSRSARQQVLDLAERAMSAASRIPPPLDNYLEEKLAELGSLCRMGVPDAQTLSLELMHVPAGQVPVRDMQALEGGWQPAGHQIIMGEVLALQAPYRVAESLARISRRIDQHLATGHPGASRTTTPGKGIVFIGHGGRSKDHLELGDLLDELGLKWDVFERQPVAGLSTKERLAEMLDDAQIAFLIMTGEDEDADGQLTARANVIHEVGLFQGRLGWAKAIVLLEEGCREFSNIVGIGQIRYPKGNIRAVFHDIRMVLEREKII